MEEIADHEGKPHVGIPIVKVQLRHPPNVSEATALQRGVHGIDERRRQRGGVTIVQPIGRRLDVRLSPRPLEHDGDEARVERVCGLIPRPTLRQQSPLDGIDHARPRSRFLIPIESSGRADADDTRTRSSKLEHLVKAALRRHSPAERWTAVLLDLGVGSLSSSGNRRTR